jgi:hypothetical protein
MTLWEVVEGLMVLIEEANISFFGNNTLWGEKSKTPEGLVTCGRQIE